MNPNRANGGESGPAPLENVTSSGNIYESSNRQASESQPSQEATPVRQETSKGPTAPVVIPAVDPPLVPSDDDHQQKVPAPQVPANNPDRIEKQWVERAKAVVAQTKADPRQQKEEMSRVKAEYIQKRFNKTIKVDGAP